MEQRLITLVDDAEEYSFFLVDPDTEQPTNCEIKYRRLSTGERNDIVKRHSKRRPNKVTGIPYDETDWLAVVYESIAECVKSWDILDPKTMRPAPVTKENVRRLPDYILVQIQDKLQIQQQGPDEEQEKNLPSSSASNADTPA